MKYLSLIFSFPRVDVELKFKKMLFMRIFSFSAKNFQGQFSVAVSINE